MVDQRKAFNFISSQDYCQTFKNRGVTCECFLAADNRPD